MLTETILTAATTRMIKSLVEKVIAPRFEKFLRSVKIDYKAVLDKNKNYFEEYYQRTYEKYSIVNTLVFRNSQRLLKDIYVDQSLYKGSDFFGKTEITKIDGMPRELIEKYKRILITDTAGMGKSTILKRMFIDLIDNGIEGVGVPIYIELNRLNKDRSLIQEIHEGLSSLSEKFDIDLLLRFIQTGGFIFFLDGYDEISIADRSVVTGDIQSFISRAGKNNYFVLTSRPEESLSSFGDFQLFRIQPLTKDDAFELLKNYDGSKEKELSEKLIDILSSGQYESIDEYLENPLLVSLLYAAFDHKNIIPLKKHLFYAQVYDAYFDAHDLSKGMDVRPKRSGLDIGDFNKILRYVGYECLIRIGVQFDKDTIISSIDRAKAFCGNLDFQSHDFLKDLMTAVPLFSKDGTEYKWAHKSLMEYFAARFIAEDAKENQDKILTAMYNSKNLEEYLNMLDLFFDIDIKGFSKNITLPYCEQFIENCEKGFDSLDISMVLYSDRISCLTFNDYALFVSSDDRDTISKVESSFYKTEKRLRSFKSLGVQDAYKVIVHFAAGESGIKYRLAYFFLSKKSPFVLTYNRGSEEFCKMRKDGLPYEICELEHGKVHVIDSKTGNQSNELYKSINVVLLERLGKRLDYEACKNEIERIKKEIAQSKDATDLLAGI